ncbi:MAG: type II toxin-antitoxin system HicA family toxin [Acidobacteria bacterium]|jgi:predicted RNA binding protein YcfA (HicA-like mRNA interferase family)|nr:type II toxin-antitoxin system HicA family toxin [Acidobacteriota bacterium]
MKRRDLVKRLEEMGCVLVRQGGKPDFYTNYKTKKSQPVPRHQQINENLAKAIIKKLSDQ